MIYLAAVVACLPLWLSNWLPMVDLPQHVAQAAMLRDLVLGTSAHADLLRLNFFTPYLLGTSLVALLMTVLPAPEAARWVVAAALGGMVLATARLLDRCGGDARLAPVTALGLYGFAFHWGFLNFLVAAPLGVLALSFVLDRQRDWVRERPVLASLALMALFFCHALVAALVIGVHLMRVAVERGRVLDVVYRIIPIAPCIVFAMLWVVLSQKTEAQVSAPTVWSFGFFRVTNLPGLVLGSDATPTLAIGLLAAASMLLAGYRLSRSLVRWTPAALAVGVMLVVPDALFGNAFTYQRFGVFVVPFLLVALEPRLPAIENGVSQVRRAAVLVAGLLVGLHVAIVGLNMRGFGRESAEFQTVLEAATPGARAVQMSIDRISLFSPAPAYLHFASWYSAEKQGIVDFSFSEFAVAVVRHRDGYKTLFPSGFEWNPGAFIELSKDPRVAEYRYFFVRSKADVARPLFSSMPEQPEEVMASGSWRLYRAEVSAEVGTNSDVLGAGGE